jgi:hypothetical protein
MFRRWVPVSLLHSRVLGHRVRMPKISRPLKRSRAEVCCLHFSHFISSSIAAIGMTLKEVTHTRSAWQGESSGLLASPSQKSAEWSLSGRSEAGAAVSRKTWWILAAASVAMIVSLGSLVPTSNTPSQISSSSTLLRSEEEDLYDELDLEMEGSTRNWAPPKAEKRCEWVVSIFTERYSTVPRKKLIAQYAKQSEDFNVFYRATAEIFWRDFALSPWGNLTLEDVGIKPEMNGVPFGEKALWTWVTGDQHLSNFGAWRNRNNEIVYGVNDFDEAAVYDVSPC